MSAERFYPGVRRKSCRVCGHKVLLSSVLGICARCIASRFEEAKEIIERRRAQTRQAFGLPIEPPRNEHGVRCQWCVNRCEIPEGGVGYCGTKKNTKGKLTHLWGSCRGLLDWYYDPVPTNCVAAWVCGVRACPTREYGCKNLSVFFRACGFNCLFCQNWHFKDWHPQPKTYTPEALAALADRQTVCICYFGGDPAPQAVFSILASKRALEPKRALPLRICWETNGSENPKILRKMAEIALKSGGIIKVDLKALDANLHQALTGSSNEWTIENLRQLTTLAKLRRHPPLLAVSTLLVPGYVSDDEVGRIAEFLACLNPEVPYSLLAFYPQFYMGDLPPTSRAHAEACYAAATAAGLRRVRIGNTHLLW